MFAFPLSRTHLFFSALGIILIGGFLLYQNKDVEMATQDKIPTATTTTDVYATAVEPIETTKEEVAIPEKESPPKRAPTITSETKTAKKPNEVNVAYENSPHVVAGSSIEGQAEGEEQSFDIRAIVLVRCTYTSQYLEGSSQPENETIHGLGSGVFVSPSGHILTAAHVIREKTLGTDDTGRTWTMIGCDISRTKDYDSRINANPKYSTGNSLFEKVTIVYEPEDEVYRDANGLDVAVLRLSNPTGNEFVTPYQDLIAFEKDMYSIIAVGYPGKDISIPQKLERFDSSFVETLAREGSVCGVEYSKICGWRYFVARVSEDVAWYFGRRTRLGIESESARPGFSGAPAFYKEKFVGLVTHGAGTGYYDTFMLLTSRDIVQHLSAKGVVLE